jgi:alkylhydroperoxidase family enzyme
VAPAPSEFAAPKRDAAIQFAHKVIETRGKVSDADLKAVRDAGYTEGFSNAE